MQESVTLACYITELKLSRAFQKGPVDRIIDKCTYCCYSPRLDILLKMCLRVESTSQWASRHEIRLCGTIFGLEKWALSPHSATIHNATRLKYKRLIQPFSSPRQIFIQNSKFPRRVICNYDLSRTVFRLFSLNLETKMEILDNFGEELKLCKNTRIISKNERLYYKSDTSFFSGGF